MRAQRTSSPSHARTHARSSSSSGRTFPDWKSGDSRRVDAVASQARWIRSVLPDYMYLPTYLGYLSNLKTTNLEEIFLVSFPFLTTTSLTHLFPNQPPSTESDPPKEPLRSNPNSLRTSLSPYGDRMHGESATLVGFSRSLPLSCPFTFPRSRSRWDPYRGGIGLDWIVGLDCGIGLERSKERREERKRGREEGKKRKDESRSFVDSLVLLGGGESIDHLKRTSGFVFFHMYLFLCVRLYCRRRRRSTSQCLRLCMSTVNLGLSLFDR
jgi:hypothetical protein